MNELQELAEKLLVNHWAMDDTAARALSEKLEVREVDQLQSTVSGISEQTLKRRDDNRATLGRIITNDSQLKLVTIGPCSFDKETDTGLLFETIAELQTRHPNVMMATRINGSKPRTKGGWTGSWSSQDPAVRAQLFDTMRLANDMAIPVLTEVTDPMQLGALAPHLSGFWLGARDITSTSLRAASSASRLPIGLKNSPDGKAETLANAINAINLSSHETGSGVDLGTIASSTKSRGIPTGILPVGKGDRTLAIIARGHEIVGSVSPLERMDLALSHLSSMTMLAAKHQTGVIIDGSHDVPTMLDIPRKESDRFPRVMDILLGAVEKGDVENPKSIRGMMGEIGTHTGATDPNWIINNRSVGELDQLIFRLEAL